MVEDDPTVAEVVTGYLRRAGHIALHAADGFSALAQAADGAVDLVVLDLMLPGIDGLEVCRRLRATGLPLPVIMLSARGEEEDRITGLEVGADDYVTKPFSPRELTLRVDSVLRRSRAGNAAAAGPAKVLRAAGLVLDTGARQAAKGGRELTLTLREFELLAWFLAHPGRAHSREELMRAVWGWEFGDLSTVTVHVRRLRSKIEDDPAAPRLIRTVWGVGYRFDPGDVERDAHAAAPVASDAPAAPTPTAPPAAPAPPGGGRPEGDRGRPADSPGRREDGAAGPGGGTGRPADGTATPGGGLPEGPAPGSEGGPSHGADGTSPGGGRPEGPAPGTERGPSHGADGTSPGGGRPEGASANPGGEFASPEGVPGRLAGGAAAPGGIA